MFYSVLLLASSLVVAQPVQLTKLPANLTNESCGICEYYLLDESSVNDGERVGIYADTIKAFAVDGKVLYRKNEMNASEGEMLTGYYGAYRFQFKTIKTINDYNGDDDGVGSFSNKLEQVQIFKGDKRIYQTRLLMMCSG